MLHPADYARPFTASGRRKLALARQRLHSAQRKPGLTGINAQGVVMNDSVPVHWYEVGEPDADVTIVYIHGFTLAAEGYYQQVDGLRDFGVRQILMDLRGHGQTGAVDPERCNVKGAADDAWAVMQERKVRGPVIFMGHSLGGLIALNLIRRYRERIDVAGLVMINASVEALSAQGLPQVLATPLANAAYRLVESSPVGAEVFRREFTKIIAPILALTMFHRDTSDELIHFHAAMIQETPLETFVGYFGDLQSHDELGAGEALRGVPGYILVGAGDQVTPLGQAQRALEMWPEAYLQIIPDAGHMLLLETPKAVNAAIARLVSIARP